MKTNFLLCTASVLAIAGCGESASPPPPSPTPTAPVTRSVTTSGPITGFSSVVVGGERYEIDNGTVVSVEGEQSVVGNQDPLRLGMIVKIRAQETNGLRTATEIEYDEDLKGPARNVMPGADDPAFGTFTVAGQTVTVDANTILDDDIGDNDGVSGIDIRDLDPVNFPGNAPIVVEVSGFPTDDGFLATRIDRVNAAAGDIGNPNVDGDEIEVKGFVDAVAADGSSFDINDATFLVTGSTIFEDGLTPDDSLVGVFVEVKADINASGDFIAVVVEREDELDEEDENGEFEIEGILQSVDTSTDPDVIVINGMTIEVSDASGLIGLVGLNVEIEGAFDSNGVLIINDIDLEEENNVRTQDRIVDIDSTIGDFTTRLGLKITPTETSRVRDNTSDDGDQLTPLEFLNRLEVDDYIEARGIPNADGTVTWTRIELEDEDDRDCVLRGPVDGASIADPVFDILEITIDTTGLGFNDFENQGDVEIGRTEFFRRLRDGSVVEATSDDDGNGCTNGRLITMGGGGVEFERGDGVERNGPGDDEGPENRDAAGEFVGEIRDLDPVTNTFRIRGKTYAVIATTLIDDTFIEAARGMEIPEDSIPFGELPESLDDLLSNGDLVEIAVDANGDILEIENAED